MWHLIVVREVRDLPWVVKNYTIVKYSVITIIVTNTVTVEITAWIEPVTTSDYRVIINDLSLEKTMMRKCWNIIIIPLFVQLVLIVSYSCY